MSCPGRHHDWDEAQNPPVCKKCGDPKGAPGRPKGSKTKKLAGSAVAGRLAATLGVAAPAPRSATPGMEPSGPPPDGSGARGAPAAAQDAAPGPAAPLPGAPAVAPGPEKAEPGKPAPPLKPKGWCKSAGHKLAKLFDLGVDFVGEEVFRREMNDADPVDVKEMGEGLGEQLSVWFPDAELGPWGKIIIAGSCIVAEKAIGSQKLPPKLKPREAIAAEKPPGKLIEIRPSSPAASVADSTGAETNPQPSPT